MSVTAVSSRPTTSSSPQQDDYTVQRGDTLSSIAARHGVSLSALEAANPQIKNPNLIYPGQDIHIPGTGGGKAHTGPVKAGGSAPTGATPSTLQGRVNEAMGYFESQGWTRAQAAGIVANLQAESSLNPGIQQYGGGPGYGLAQWEGPRQALFKQVMGRDIHGSSFGQQLQFVQWELTHTESGAGNALRGATTAYDAGATVCRDYERPADISGQSRYRGNLAQQIYSNANPTPGPKPPGPGPKPAPNPTGGSTYTVRSGDTMTSIAAHHHVSLSALERANPQISNPNKIYVGEKIHIPGTGGSKPKPAPATTYTVRSGDTMTSIAARHHVSLSALEKANPQISNPNKIYVGEKVHIPGSGGSKPAPKPATHNYTVQRGDTMSSIASRNGVSLSALERANPQIHNPNVIYPGEVVHIPGAGSTGPVHSPGPVKGTNAASIAKHYYGEYESQLQRDGVTLNCPTSESCANFVTAMLIKAGKVSPHGMSYVQRVNVHSMASYLKAHGWHVVPKSQAKPGDVWVCDGAHGESHTELVYSNANGKVTLIGSNNHPVNSNQQINYDGYSASIGGSYILAPP